MNAQEVAVQRLHKARMAFDVAGISYALLTSADSRDLVTQHTVELREGGFSILPRHDQHDDLIGRYTSDRVTVERGPAPARRGSSRQVSFNRAVDVPYATAMLDIAFEKMISDSVDATKVYARAVEEWAHLKREQWFVVATQLRNAYSHNGLWDFRSHVPLPATWRRYTITADMAGQPAAGYMSYFDGSQLASLMMLYVQGVTDYAGRDLRHSGGTSSNDQPLP